MNLLQFLKEILYSAWSVIEGIKMTFGNLLGLPVRSYYTMLGHPEPPQWANGKAGGWLHRRKRVTQLYPEEKWDLAPRFRGMPVPTVIPDTGEMWCIACLACVRICPSQIIDIQWHKPGPGESAVNSKGKKLVKLIDRFEIDMGRCLFCALCVEICPTNPKSIVMSREFELGDQSRTRMVFQDRTGSEEHILPMVPVNGVEDQPQTAYVNAALTAK
jgi:NADH-quinone oxidoreductase subunit I